jgi:hypothetical protein
MRFVRVLILTVALAPAVSGCNNNATTATGPTQNLTTDILTGTVQPPVNGVLQSSTNNFTVGQGGGSISVQLTSATETLPGGNLQTGVTMLISIGTVSGSTCTPIANAQTTAGSLTGSLAAGTFCVQVSDATNQLGPVAYAVAVQHP